MIKEFFPMSHRPKVAEENLSEMVLVYDEDLEDCDLGYYDFDEELWSVMGGFSMRLKCWCYLPRPTKETVKDFKIQTHAGYVE